MGYVAVFASWLVAGTFGIAAVAKLRDLGGFVASVVALRLVPPRLARPSAVSVVAGELLVALLCLVPSARTAPIGLVLGAGLFVLFALVAMSARLRRRVVPCRCFGRRGAPLGPRHAVRNGVLAAVAVTGAATLTVHPVPDSAAGMLLTGVVAAVAVAVVTVLDELIDLVRVPEQRPSR